MRTVAAGLAAALRGERPDLVVLLALETGGTPATVYLTSRAEAVTWDGQAYAVRALELPDELRMENQGEISRLTLHVANRDRYFQGLRAAGATFRRQRCTVRVTEQSRLTASPAEAIRDVLYVDSFAFTEGLFTLELVTRSAILDGPFPAGVLTRQEYPGLPRDSFGL